MASPPRLERVLVLLLVVLVLCARVEGSVSCVAAGGKVCPAPDSNSVVALDSTIGGSFTEVDAAEGQGFTVVLATGAEWSQMTTSEFSGYKAIILGDPSCSSSEAASAGFAVANNGVWGAATKGNIIIIGTDPVFHGKNVLINNAVAFAASGDKTGAVIMLSCYYSDVTTPVVVPLLSVFGDFEAANPGGCFNNAHVVASHPALATLDDAALSGWGCSVHEAFTKFPFSEWSVLAIARDSDIAEIEFADGSKGSPYILVSGTNITVIETEPPTPEPTVPGTPEPTAEPTPAPTPNPTPAATGAAGVCVGATPSTANLFLVTTPQTRYGPPTAEAQCIANGGKLHKVTNNGQKRVTDLMIQCGATNAWVNGAPHFTTGTPGFCLWYVPKPGCKANGSGCGIGNGAATKKATDPACFVARPILCDTSPDP